MGIYRRLFSCCRGRVDRRMSYNNKDRAGVAAMLERFEANVERDGCVPLQISLRGRNMKRGVTMPHLVRKRSPSFKQRVMSPLANTTVIVARNHTNFSWGTNLPVYLPSKLQRTPGENRCLFNRMEVQAEARVGQARDDARTGREVLRRSDQVHGASRGQCAASWICIPSERLFVANLCPGWNRRVIP